MSTPVPVPSSVVPDYHVPVMLQECMDGLTIRPDGIYVDATFGGGGHSRAILSRLTTGKLLAFDQDPDAARNARELADDPRFLFIAANFRHLSRYLRLNKLAGVHGILADLGVSSHQIDEAARGFSTRFDARLDMRMNQSQDETAWHIINEYSAEALQLIFSRYGELQNARTLAGAVYATRQNGPIDTVMELIAILKRFAPRFKEFKYYAQVFQALRIEVNQELKVLEEFLLQTPDALLPGGRLVVMSYHSLEDRLVKNFIRNGKFEGEADKDFYGNVLKPLRAVTRKPLEAGAAEVSANPRARSARLRIADKPDKTD